MVFLEISENSQENTCASKLVQVFSCEFSEISNNTFFTEHLPATASEEHHLPFKQTGTTTIFHSDTNPVLGHALILWQNIFWL